MRKLISRETDSDLTKLGFYQIAGGILGIIFMLIAIYSNPVLSGIAVLIYLLILLFFGYSILCGFFCVKARKNALLLSLANQILQILGFAMMGFAFKYVAGVYFSIGLDLTEGTNLSFGAGVSKFAFNFNNEEGRLELDINIIALALIYWIDNLMKRIKEESTLRQVSSIGAIEMEPCQTEE